jgi:hypothetical protein
MQDHSVPAGPPRPVLPILYSQVFSGGPLAAEEKIQKAVEWHINSNRPTQLLLYLAATDPIGNYFI